MGRAAQLKPESPRRRREMGSRKAPTPLSEREQTEMDGEGGGGGEVDTGRSELASHLEATNSSEKCPDCVKLGHAPLDNEYEMRTIFEGHSVTNELAMVPDAITNVGTSYVKLEEDEAGSGCEGFGCIASTSIDGKVGKKRAMRYSPSPTPSKRRHDKDSPLHHIENKSRKNSEIAQMLDMVIEDGAEKGSDVYFYATQLLKKKEIRDMFRTFKTPNGRLGWLKRTWDPVTEEITRVMDMAVKDGVEEGSDEYFYATQLFVKMKCRDVFFTLKTPSERLAWIKRTWEEKKKH